jgi:hypothetical protein
LRVPPVISAILLAIIAIMDVPQLIALAVGDHQMALQRL